jgi:RNA polymerase sigma factor (sigma-70 family)
LEKLRFGKFINGGSSSIGQIGRSRLPKNVDGIEYLHCLYKEMIDWTGRQIMRRIISAMFNVLRDPDQLSPDRCMDSELIARIVRHHDSAALELIFWRHGPLVWSVCCRVLGASADAEDAFQATFLILSRKARTITNRATLAGWLHRVAWRTALNVQKTRSRRIAREFPFENACAIARNDDPSLRLQSTEQNEILDRELAQLPRKYCLPLILCDMESWTREAAAAELKCPLGTLNSRLSRGREMLRVRLERCGVTFTGLAVVLLVPASVTATWQQLCTSPPKSVQQLADTTIRSMALTGLRKAFAVTALCGILIAGTTLMAMGVADGPKNPPSPAKNTAQNSPPAPEEKKETASRFIDPNAGPLPEGAVARIGSNRLRHAGDVTGLKYSPDGKWLASISTSPADATARLWNAATGKQQLLVKIKTTEDDRESPGHISRALGFSKDGKQFFVLDMSSFRAFDIDSGKELFAHPFPLKVPPKGKGKRAFLANAIGAAISPDGKTYVLIQWEGQIEIRDVATGNVLQTVEHSFERYSYVPIEFSPDNRHIVVGEREVALDLPLPIIEVATGKTISRIEGNDLLRSLRFVPSTDKLVGFGPEASVQFKPGTDRPVAKDRQMKDVAKFFDWKSGKPLRTIDVDRSTYVIDVSPDGKILVAGNGGRDFSQLLDIESGKEIARIPSTPSLKTLAFSPDGKLLAGARPYSGAITVWDMATRDYHATAAEPVGFFGVEFGPDSNTLAIPEAGNPLLDWRTGKIVERLEGEGTLSPNRRWFAKWDGKNKSLDVVDAKTGKEFRSFKGHTEFVQNLSFSPDESRLATGSYDKTIRVWSMKTGEELAQFTAPDLTGHESISLSDDGRIVAVGVNQKLQNRSGSIILIWDVDSKKQLARIEDETVFFSAVAVSPNGKWIAAGGGKSRGDWEEKIEETAVHIWETATGRPVHTLAGHNCKYVHAGAHCTFSSDSRWLATGDAAGKLRIWEVLTGQEVRSFAGHHSTVIAHFSPDGKLLVAASDEAPCFIWDVLNVSNQASKLTAAELQASWNDLGKSDAKLAFEAIGRLVNNPDLAIERIRKNLKPAAAIDPRAPDMSSKRLEETRALSVLEFIGNSEAIKLLDELAMGAKDDVLTRAAIDTRERLRGRK